MVRLIIFAKVDFTELINAFNLSIYISHADVMSNRKMLHLLLKHRGFALIDQCVNGKEAVDYVSEKGNDHFDLIFLDNLMPIMVSQDHLTSWIYITII